MAKPQPIRVPSDDCLVDIDGTEYAVHEGEWVEVIPGISVGDIHTFRGLQELQVKLDAIKGESNEAERQIVLMDDSYGGVLDLVRRRIRAWSWTDDLGDPLPQPKDDPSVFERLRPEEIMYLALVVMGNNPEAEKNGSRPSLTTSSATAPRPSRTSSSGGRSHTRG